MSGNKSIKEYEIGDYLELGKKLGEAMFYFVKFQNFVEKFERINQSTSIKPISNFNETKIRKIDAGRRFKSITSKQPVFESVQDKEIFQDILKEYKNTCEEIIEESDDSFYKNVIEEIKLKSLINGHYQLITHKPLVDHILNSVAMKEKVLDETIVKPLSYEKSNLRVTRGIINNYPISNHNINYEPKRSIEIFKHSQYNRSKHEYNLRLETKVPSKQLDYTSVDKVSVIPLLLLQSIKWRAILKKSLVQNCSQVGINDRYLFGLEELGRVGYNTNPLSINSQKAQLFKRMSSNACRRNTMNSQLNTRNKYSPPKS
jgi:hypothetical protein